MKQWVNNIEQLREAYAQIAEDMREDHKPRSIDVKIPVNKRSAEINSVFHIVIRQIRKHLFKSGLGYVEYEDEYTGTVRMPLDDDMVKALVKQILGTKITVLETSFAKPTRNYQHDEMYRKLKHLEVWASSELNFDLVYQKRIDDIEKKYADQTGE